MKMDRVDVAETAIRLSSWRLRKCNPASIYVIISCLFPTMSDASGFAVSKVAPDPVFNIIYNQ
jgi:hypothetical protein